MQKINGMKNRLSSMLVAGGLMAVALGGMVPAAHAGRVGGPGSTSDVVSARTTDSYSIRFRGGETGSILVNGDGDTDLDLYVYDGNGNLVAKDDDYTDTCLAQFYARSTQTYTVRIVNRGNVENYYDLETN